MDFSEFGDYVSTPNTSESNPSNPFAASSVNPAAPSATAVQLINIRNHVTVILDFEESNFCIWQTFFNLTFRKLGLLDHIDGSVDALMALGDVEWTQIDQCIVSWLYTTVSKDILEIIIQPSHTAANAWTVITELFRDNRLQRSIFAKRDFLNLVQGDLSVTAFASRLKCLSDTLRDVGTPVNDQDMLTTFINGLNGEFGHCIAALTINPAGLTFARARGAILQEERWLARHAQQIRATALVANRFSAPPASPASRPPVPSPTSAAPASGGRGRGKGRKKQQQPQQGLGAATGAAPGRDPAAPFWPVGSYPLSGMFQAWPPNWRAPGAGLLGPRPGVSTPQAYTAHLGQQGYGTPSVYNGFPPPSLPLQPPAWDQTQLHAALNNLSVQQGGAGGSGSNWFFDTGATAHMTSDPGSSYPRSDSPM
ncbi:uncharacterized protein [Aegilops tauschii subsp. strangulata]|uniref:uncharacterized protein n=1 Tax=Aegilops tauschii subsp. strangulata TaxID=200361 RepID=UPI000989FC06|nr:uncharacterized protein LOC109732973 [Aegilops tauschii subsp. strangulata]